jgi:hypothetical protein
MAQAFERDFETTPSGTSSFLRKIFGKKSEAPKGFTETYTDPVYYFSFSYLPILKLYSSLEGDATILVARDTAKTIAFQLTTRPIGGTDPRITPAWLARDMPKVATRGHELLRLRGVKGGLVFYATDRNFGESFQAWFIREGRLYQLSCYARHAELLRGVLASWYFTK